MKDIFGKELSVLKEKRLYLLDMDGTIYLGDHLFDCTLPFLKRIKGKGARAIYITNNSSKSVSTYVEKLHRLGIIEVTEQDFFTSIEASALLLKKRFPGQLIYVQGTKSFVSALKESGIPVTEEVTDKAVAILVGFDSELTMEKLTKTSKMLTFYPDLPYFATNPDWVCPTSWGYVPDCGSMCFSLGKATGRKPYFIGKPEKTMVECAIEKNGFSKEDTVVIGDRLYTDIASGNHAGVTTVCVLTGEVKKEEVLSSCGDQRPDFLVHDLSEVL